jgi:cob(I)alamin adenosyltransferase
LVKDQAIDNDTKTTLIKIQNDLFTLGSMMATPSEKETLKNGEQRLNIPEVDTKSVTYLEKEIDKMNEKLPKMTHFILPGGHTTVSYCHIARCVCRRAERLSVSLHQQEGINPIILTYLNRLSDFLFMLARKLSKDLSVQEVKWIPEKL